MAWVGLDDHIDQHPKIASAGPLASWVFVRSLCYCNRMLTDGFFQKSIAKELGATRRIIEKLLAVRLWEEADGGYRVHDYAAYQLSKQQVLDRRADTQKRVANWRGRNTAGNADVTALHDGYNDVSNTAPNPNPKKLPKKVVTRVTEINDEFVEAMVDRFGRVFGGRASVVERINATQGHKSWSKWTDKQAGVINWLQSDADRVAARSGSGNGVATRSQHMTTPEDKDMDEQIAAALQTGRIRGDEPVKLGDLMGKLGSSHG